MFRAIGTFFLSICLLGNPLLPYETELSDTAVREAYFLGQRNDDKMRAFFSPYTKHLPLPKKALRSQRFACPRSRRSFKRPARLGPGTARTGPIAYQKRGDTILLVVHLLLTATYGEIDAEHNARRRPTTRSGNAAG